MNKQEMWDALNVKLEINLPEIVGQKRFIFGPTNRRSGTGASRQIGKSNTKWESLN